MKQAMLTALCTLLLLSVALGGVGYSNTVNFLEKTVGSLADNLERVKGIFGTNKDTVTPAVGSELLNQNNITNIDESVTLKEFIIHFAKDDGCIIPDIDLIYPKMYKCTIKDIVVFGKNRSYDVEGVRFRYNGNEYYYWDIHGYSTGGAWKGYSIPIDGEAYNYTKVVKSGVGDWHFSVEKNLDNLLLRPHDWRFNFTIRETDTNVIDYFRTNID